MAALHFMAEVKMPITDNMDVQNRYLIENGKQKSLKNLDFKLLTTCKNPQLRSSSNKIYTDIYNLFYKKREKILTPENILLLDHSIELACLYMDDGSLVIDSSKRKNGSIYIFRGYTFTLSIFQKMKTYY